jgi:[ribosomal protein S5]-alanine N-acetyltransferase
MESQNSRLFALVLAGFGGLLAGSGLVALWSSHPAHHITLGPIVGQRLLLRLATPEDADGLASTIDEAMTTENHWAPEDVERFTEAVRCGTMTDQMIVWSVADECIVGAISARGLWKSPGQRELGIWIGPSHRHHGFAAEALALLANHLHRQGVSRVVAESADTNDYVRRAFLSAGFRIKGTGRHVFTDGEEVDSLLYIFSPETHPA